MLMKAGAHITLGIEHSIPDLEKAFLNGVVSIPDLQVVGDDGVPREQVELHLKEHFINDVKESAEQWLVDFPRGKDIAKLFGFGRVWQAYRPLGLAKEARFALLKIFGVFPREPYGYGATMAQVNVLELETWVLLDEDLHPSIEEFQKRLQAQWVEVIMDSLLSITTAAQALQNE
ncbi:unnamed protein product [Sphagnum troendelagicum]|uniref:Uncharacterized protein n=1 Tax=Sphagnum troendelagicum TaxID=128251 RepID=A0ABP0U6E0_9BRYO